MSFSKNAAAAICLFSSLGFGQAPSSKPLCFRPKDFSFAKLVTSYEACLERQRIFCLSHERLKDCAPPKAKGTPYYLQTQDEIDPTKRCMILKDGSYKCLQDPVRFVVAEAQGTGSGTKDGGPNFTPVPVEGETPDNTKPGAPSLPGPLPDQNAAPATTQPQGIDQSATERPPLPLPLIPGPKK